jgi:hypothetical protein
MSFNAAASSSAALERRWLGDGGLFLGELSANCSGRDRLFSCASSTATSLPGIVKRLKRAAGVFAIGLRLFDVAAKLKASALGVERGPNFPAALQRHAGFVRLAVQVFDP